MIHGLKCDSNGQSSPGALQEGMCYKRPIVLIAFKSPQSLLLAAFLLW